MISPILPSDILEWGYNGPWCFSKHVEFLACTSLMIWMFWIIRCTSCFTFDRSSLWISLYNLHSGNKFWPENFFKFLNHLKKLYSKNYGTLCPRTFLSSCKSQILMQWHVRKWHLIRLCSSIFEGVLEISKQRAFKCYW